MKDRLKAALGTVRRGAAKAFRSVKSGEDALRLPMLRRLRWRLAIIFTSLSGVILAAVLVIAAWFSISQMTENNENQFYSTAALYTSELVTAREVTPARLAEIEEQSGYFLYAMRDGENIAFTHTSSYADGLLYEIEDEFFISYELFNTNFAIETMDGEYYFENGAMEAVAVTEDGYDWEDGVEIRSSVIGDGDYAATDIYIETLRIISSTGHDSLRDSNGNSYRVVNMNKYDEEGDILYDFTILQPLEGEHTQRFWLIFGFVFMGLAGFALLWLVSWFLARLVLRPTAEGIVKQSEFVAAASHELKNPLAVMRSSLSAARVVPEQAARYQTAAEHEAERMSRLVEDLLVLAGGDAGTWALRKEPVDMDTLLIEAAELYRPHAKARGNKLLLRLPEQALGEVPGDADRLHQILGILLDNALQYAPEGTGVVLCAKAHKGKILVEVIDHGPGIPDEMKPKVFDRFFRADSSRTDKKHFGLGLSVAKELSDLHGATLRVKDTEGGGATFQLELSQG